MSLSFASPRLAWLRAVPDSMTDCLRERPEPIDVSVARAQHRAYAAALADAGVELRWLPAEEFCPDCVYIEDTALLLGPLALRTVPGAPSRRAEVDPVATALAAELPVRAMALPATLDGGDVLRAGERLFVGLSGRTNAGGLGAIRAVAEPLGLRVVPVPVTGGLHLKSAITMATPTLALLVRGALDPGPFQAAGLEILEVDEPLGGNVLGLADRVIVSAQAPETAATLATRGLRVVSVNVSELHKGDGALTCLSLRQPPPGCWCC